MKVVHHDKCEECGGGSATIPTNVEDWGDELVQLYMCETCWQAASAESREADEQHIEQIKRKAK